MLICRGCNNIYDKSSLIYDEDEDYYICPNCGEEVYDEYDDGWDAYNATQREREEQQYWR